MNEKYTKIFNELVQNDSIINDIPNKGYHSLFMAVILQALLDVTKPKQLTEDSQITIDRKSAKSWFFATTGVTCENFEGICDSAGVQPVIIRSLVDQILNEKDASHVRKRISSFLITSCRRPSN